jgi:tRNA threonylcarbamoyl adenosine modification protein TsaD
MRILAIETSCDETALALVEASGGLRAPKFKILRNLVASQIDAHRPFGGVVPMLAKREHEKNLPRVLSELLAADSSGPKLKAQSLKSSVLAPSSYLLAPDLLAVTVGPGLEPALWAGIEFAKELHSKLKAHNPKLPIIGANHLEGHLYSFLLQEKTESSKSKFQISKLFPAIALIVSGGHTMLLKMDSLTKWKRLGETRDDAVGEAFDKVARILGLPYPGGPEIQKAAERGNPAAVDFPRPMIHSKDFDFSFSGLKTAVLYYVRDHKPKAGASKFRADIAASFQQAAVDVLAAKAAHAVKAFGAKSIFLSGGVAANAAIRSRLSVVSRELSVNFLVPPITFNTDNATMIAAAAYIQHLQKKKNRLVANGTMTV